MSERFTILGGKVHIYRRPNSSSWQCASFLAGKNRRTTTKEESLSKAKEVAEDWYLQLRGKLRDGELQGGNPVVLGVQGMSQMEKRYGRDAESMLSQPATKIFLKTSEPRAAKWVSDSIGEIEVERLRESRSMGLLRSKKSFAMDIATKPLVMASEIAGLSPLQGFIKLENSVVSVKFQLVEKREHEAAFVGCSEQVQSDGLLKGMVIETPALLPEKQLQAEIPFPEKQKKQASGFTWDSKNEIE